MTAITKVTNTAIANVEYFSASTIEEFIASRHCAPNTARTYRNALRQLLKHFAAQGISTPTTADVDGFINGLRGAKKSDSTLRLYSTVTSLYFSFLGNRGIYPDVAADAAPLKLRKTTTHKKKSLSLEQAQKLLAAVKGDSLIARRDRAIVALALSCGVRTCEISRADVGDLSDDGCGGYFWSVQGKGRIQKDAQVRVAPAVRALIDSYLELRGKIEDAEPLFTSTSRNVGWDKNKYGVRLSEQSIGKMIKLVMKSVGINDRRITAHSTRHFAATTAIKNGVDLREVSAMLRHASLNVTMTYLHDLSVENRRAEMSVANSLFSAA